MGTERVSEKVWLIFFDTVTTPFDVTGKTYFQINAMTKNIKAGGGTAIGCGVEYLRARGEEIDAISIVSDGGDNSPYNSFATAYKRYSNQIGKEPTIYLFEMDGEPNSLKGQVEMEIFNLRGGKVDYNSLPNIVQTLRVNKYSLLDEIMNTPLLKMDMVFSRKDN